MQHIKSTLNGLLGVLEDGSKESIKSYIDLHGEILSWIFKTDNIHPQAKLGTEFTTDFHILYSEPFSISTSHNEKSIEVESSYLNLFTNYVESSARPVHAYRPIQDWQAFLADNRAHFYKSLCDKLTTHEHDFSHFTRWLKSFVDYIQSDGSTAKNILLLETAVQYMQGGQFSKVEENCRKVLLTEPANGMANHLLGGIAYQTGDYKGAEDFIRKALEVNPDDPQAHNNLANTLKKLARLGDAEDHYKKALEIDPNYGVAHNGLGVALKEQGQFDESLEHFKKSVFLDPNNGGAHYNLGNALLVAGQGDAARKSFCDAIDLEPHNGSFWFGFESSLGASTFFSVEDSFFDYLSRLLDQPYSNPKNATKSMIEAMRHDPKFFDLLNCLNSKNLDHKAVYQDANQLFLSVPLLLKIMKLTTINDLVIEELFTFLRRSLIKSVTTWGGGRSRPNPPHRFGPPLLY